MKKHLVVVAAVILAAALSGCAKEPVEEFKASEAAIEAVDSAEGAMYAAKELLVLKRDMAAARDEILVQNDKYIKNFDQAKQMLARVTEDSEKLKVVIASRKEEARQDAVAAQEAAGTSITDAENLLSVAPEGKGSSAEIEAMGVDLKALVEAMGEVQALIDGGNYAGAVTKANAIAQNADEISAEVKQAMEKIAQEQAERERIAREKAAAAKPARARTSRK